MHRDGTHNQTAKTCHKPDGKTTEYITHRLQRVVSDYLDAVFEDEARTGQAGAFTVHLFLAEHYHLIKEKNSSVVKLQLVSSRLTARLRNKQAVLLQQPALCRDLTLNDIQTTNVMIIVNVNSKINQPKSLHHIA